MAAASTVAKWGKLSDRRSGIFKRSPPLLKQQSSLRCNRAGAGTPSACSTVRIWMKLPQNTCPA
eukprot:3267084-Pyramimonas_sp.AAC.1